MTQLAIFDTVGAAIIVEFDVKVGKISLVFFARAGDELFLGATARTSALHDRRAMRIVRTNVNRPMSAQLLKPNPDVGLNVLDQMADVDRAVGIWQRGGYQNSSWHGCGMASRIGHVVAANRQV